MNQKRKGSKIGKKEYVDLIIRISNEILYLTYLMFILLLSLELRLQNICLFHNK